MRVKAVLTYDGTDFEGFQRQTRTANTVTGAIESALHALQIDSPITGSGRTDAGVHASNQVIHFDLPPFWHDLDKLRSHLNGRLEAIAFKHITPVADDFHARFDAKQRTYRYLFATQELSVFEKRYVAQIAPLDLKRLEAALRLFEGKHDFGYFMKTGSETKSTLRTLHQTRLKKVGKYYAVYFRADGFLRAQVRMMLSAAFDVATGKMDASQLIGQLSLHHRHSTRLAPPQGLYLARVIY